MQANPAVTIDPEFFTEFAERVKDAWNRHDPEAVASLCTEDVSWADAGLPVPARGRAEVASFVTETAMRSRTSTSSAWSSPRCSRPSSRLPSCPTE